MGCINFKGDGYTNTKFEEEIDLRIFEEEELKAFTRQMNDVINRCISEQALISMAGVDDMVLKDYSETFFNFLHQGYFIEDSLGKKFYVAQKVKMLFFLFSFPTLIESGKIKYYDKAGFIFSCINFHNSEELNSPIDMENNSLLSFVELLVDISCVGIVNSWIKMKSGIKKESIEKLGTVKDKIVKAYIENLFTESNSTKAKCLTFDSLNKKFENNPYLFTSGDIRDMGLVLLSQGLPNEEERKKGEKEKEQEKGMIKDPDKEKLLKK